MLEFKTPDPAVELFIAKCLQILDKRYRESREGRRYKLSGSDKYKKFSERELGDETGINWPALKDGRRRSLPPREMVMIIADYLECSLNERNELLAAASYSPVELFFEGEALEEVLRPYRVILFKYLHYPALIINRNWNILDVNPALLTLMEIDPEAIQSLPGYMFNMLWLTFDPNLPVRAKFESIGQDYWLQTARRDVLGFRLDNQRCTQEKWYKDTVERLKTLPDFAEIYEASDPLNSSDREGQHFVAKILRSDGEIAKVRMMFIRTGQPDYPQIVFYLPDDKYTENLFNHLGFSLPEWHSKYILM